MKIILALVVVILLVIAYYSVTTYQKFSAAQKLIAKAEPFQKNDGDDGPSLLVLGDSTAVGVGAYRKEDTIPALLGFSSVENKAVSGARVADLEKQMTEAQKEKYDLILIMIGANDVIRFANAKRTAEALRKVLGILPENERLVFVLSAGNVGGTKLFPWFVRPFHTRLNMKYHDEFETVVTEAGGEYVNLYENPKTDPFIEEPHIYLAPDGLHPSSKGYAVWLEKILKQTGLVQ
ncbi:MAG: GDSL-type esterase/lipase family protein [Candidatus Paceibacterota bacterium]